MQTITINNNLYYFEYIRSGEFEENLYLYLYKLGAKVQVTTSTRKYWLFGEKTTTTEEVQQYQFLFSVYIGCDKTDLDIAKLKKAEEAYIKTTIIGDILKTMDAGELKI